MFCPRCGREQAADDVRFCSRCGFQLHVVAQLLDTNGALPGFETEENIRPSLYRRATSSAGAKVMFVSIVIFIFVIFLAAAADAPELLFFPFFLFIIGAAMLAYKLIFGEKPPTQTEVFTAYQKTLYAAGAPATLPPATSTPVNAYEKPKRNTAEFVPPPSVTEPTTKLLEQEANKTNDL